MEGGDHPSRSANTSPGNPDQAASIETLRHLAAPGGKGVRLFYGHDPEFWRHVPQAQALV